MINRFFLKRTFSLIIILAGFGFCSTAQTITGKVIDIKGTPMPLVNVLVKGSSTGVLTADDGSFSINVSVKTNPILIFSFIGYANQEETVGLRTVINVTLNDDVSKLDEVVVVGYGVQKKANLTGSLSSLNTAVLKDRPVSNVSTAIQGTMPGVTVVQNNGQPGKNTGSIRVRGIGTMNVNDPMVIIDGVVANSINDVNAEDIENLTVLKDAASAAIYGSRAANGVVLITTKQGKKNSLNVSFSMNMGIQAPTRLPNYLSSADNAILYNEALRNEGKPERYSKEQIDLFANGSDPFNYPNTDWLDLFYRGSGVQQNYYFDINGGSDKTRYAASIGYFDQKGIVDHTSFKRYTSRVNISSNISSKLLFSTNLAYTLGDTKEPTNPYTNDFEQFFRQIYRISPTVPYKYQNGHYGALADGAAMAWLENGSVNTTNRHNIVTNVNFEYEIIEGLKFKPTLGYNLIMTEGKGFVKDIQFYNAKGDKTNYQGPNFMNQKTENATNVLLQGLLNYNKTLNNKHQIGILAGYSQEYTKYQWHSGYRKNFQNNELGELNVGSTDGQEAKGAAHEIALMAFFGRISYDFQGKYLLEANIRRDGSSKFAKGSKWGTFPAFSAGWRIAKESFMNEMKWISDLKVRASWGKLGNQYMPENSDPNKNIGQYPTLETYESGEDYNFGGIVAPGIAAKKGVPAKLKWEESTNYGLGLDLALFQYKLNFSADYYIRNTTDILYNAPVANLLGQSDPIQNIGEMQNKGWEFMLSYQSKIGEFSYNLSGNMAIVNNKLISLKNPNPIVESKYFLIQEGHSFRSLYGFETLGIFQSTDEINAHATQSPRAAIKPGDLKYKDQNGDGVINGDDRINLGNNFPAITYGLNLAAHYKNFDISIFLQGTAKSKGVIYGETAGRVGDQIGKATEEMMDRWTPETPNGKYPRTLTTQKHNFSDINLSSFWVKNAAYLRLKNVQLGYSLPANLLSRIGIQRLRLFYSGQNLCTITAFTKGFDPEAPISRGGAYPQTLINSLGLNLTF